ncbi:sulfite exporter TauE/SafE family protein [Sphingomonas sp. PL-96]|uniref:sulfite exporter TauE/SafE family protein n=1 Tax=Sphingomonas sp. PL-96 TaxID=2887201 RepID=UPI001E5DBF25|nr:sulfite exporter TauE/SafE family protein [Sphingomonas sp. PL-96]MCC2976906.1 sulfite exporter TauE/SafE family protein [Sphingomonas sp. PL-96]
MDLYNMIAGLTVGLLVGVTGVGGGSLMAPILILLLGVAPITAVGTDLWFAAITKSVGGFIHHRHRGTDGGPDFQIVRRLCAGSLPAAAVTLWLLARTDTQSIKGGLILHLLGAVLLLTAAATLVRPHMQRAALRFRAYSTVDLHRLQTPMTVVAGALLGVMVTLTSVGAGALGAVMLFGLYPLRLTTRKLVATDIVHAVPLTLVAGLGHLSLGNVNAPLLGGLLLGSIPGIIAGSLFASRASDRLLRPLLALVLVITGARLLV